MSKAWTYRYRAAVGRITDGDTLIMMLDLGIRMTATIPVRLAGCNAAEKTTPEGLAATAFVDQWAKDYAVDGWLAVITHKNPGDNYGRWLAEVQSLDGLHDLTDDLIAAGHAVAYDGTGTKPEPPLVPPE